MTQRYLPGQPHQLPRHNQPMAGYQPEHFLLFVKDGVATVSLNRPEPVSYTHLTLPTICSV